ncbi:MAG: SGNH/GDSL hydrolase family protein [Patescibacteria group bacterium]|nr:SGNH/GDSL hydrolase family protein [Patescibacteria group bacterium]
MSKRKTIKRGHLLVGLVTICLLLLGIIFLIRQTLPKLFSAKATNGITEIAVLGDSISNMGIVSANGWTIQYKTDVDAQFQESSQIINLSTNGISSQQLLDSVLNNTTYRQQIAAARIITLEIGYNDFFQNRTKYQNGSCGGTDNQDCLRSMVTIFNNNWDAIVGQIKLLTANNTNNVAIRAFDIYYSVAGVDQLQSAPYNGQFYVLNPYLTQMNTHIAQSASQNGFLFAKVHSAYNGSSGAEDPIAKGYILPDAIHPTDLGHTVIASLLKSIGYSPLTPPAIKDTDGDGCPDVKELSSDWKLGGQRDPNNRWDFFDVPVPAISATNWNLPVDDPRRPKFDHIISAADAQAVFAYVGTRKGGPPNSRGFSYDTNYGYKMGLTNDPNFTDGMFYDRTPSTDSARFWRTGPPAGTINTQIAQLEFSLFQKGGSDCR